MSMFEPSLLGPKQEVLSLMYLTNFWFTLCSSSVLKKFVIKLRALACFYLCTLARLCAYDSSKQSLKPLRFFSIHLQTWKSKLTALTLILHCLLAVKSLAQPFCSPSLPMSFSSPCCNLISSNFSKYGSRLCSFFNSSFSIANYSLYFSSFSS